MKIEPWRKRDNPVIVVEAVLLNEDNAIAVAEWCQGELLKEYDSVHPEEEQWGINVLTANEMQRASLGMYVIKFGKHFFVSHNRKFELAYEPVDRPAPAPQTPREARQI